MRTPTLPAALLCLLSAACAGLRPAPEPAELREEFVAGPDAGAALEAALRRHDLFPAHRATAAGDGALQLEFITAGQREDRTRSAGWSAGPTRTLRLRRCEPDLVEAHLSARLLARPDGSTAVSLLARPALPPEGELSPDRLPLATRESESQCDEALRAGTARTSALLAEVRGHLALSGQPQ